jgi:hypothetical protein
MKRLMTLTVVLVIPIVVGATVITNREAGAASAPGTIHVVVKMTSAKRAAGGHLGLVAGDVLTPSGAKIGRYQGECFQVTNDTNSCTFTLALPNGHIAFLGAYGPGFSANTSARSPIAGGTSAYSGARGEVDEQETGNVARLTIHVGR